MPRRRKERGTVAEDKGALKTARTDDLWAFGTPQLAGGRHAHARTLSVAS